jgi:uncharacterized protein (TIRG00374 family)
LRAAVRPILVTALGVGLLAYFLRNADLARVWREMQSARMDLLTVGLVMTIVMYFVRAERWQYLLEPLGPTRFWVAFRTTVIGFAISFILPARPGEVLRPYLLARQEGLRATATFATIAVERMLDLAAVLLLLGAYFVFVEDGAQAAAPRLYQAVAWGALIMVPVGIGIVALMFIMAGHPERLHGLVLGIERVLPARLAHAVARFSQTFAEGLAVVRRPSRLVLSLAWSLVLWLLIAAQIWIVARAFQIAMPLGGSLLITAMLVVGVSLPTPGGVGGVHEAFRLGVTSFYGADNDAAVGAALLQHAINFVLITALGVWFMAQDGLTFGRMKQLAAESPGGGGGTT